MKRILSFLFLFGAFTSIAQSHSKSVLDTMVFDLANATTTTTLGTTYYEFPVYAITTGGISSFDFWFQFNETKLTYDTTFVIEPNLDSYSYFNASNHNLSNTTSGPSLTYVLPGNTTLLKLRFILTSSSTTIDAADFFACTALFNGNPCNYYWTAPATNNGAGISELNLHNVCVANIYPNPASNYIQLNSNEESLVEVYDLNGSKVMEKRMFNEQDQLSIENLENSIYWLKISSASSICKSRIVKLN
jgi:hypothetical protein